MSTSIAARYELYSAKVFSLNQFCGIIRTRKRHLGTCKPSHHLYCLLTHGQSSRDWTSLNSCCCSDGRTIEPYKLRPKRSEGRKAQDGLAQKRPYSYLSYWLASPKPSDSIRVWVPTKCYHQEIWEAKKSRGPEVNHC